MTYVLMTELEAGAIGEFFTQEGAYRAACRYACQLGEPVYIYSGDMKWRHAIICPEDKFPEVLDMWRVAGCCEEGALE